MPLWATPLTQFPFVLGFVPGTGAGLLGLALMAGAALVWRRRANLAGLDDLGDDPSPAPAYPAAVHYLVKDCHRGRDQGLVTFLDGWMLFEGRRTRFALRAVDVRSLAPDAGDLEMVLKARRQSMLLQGGRAFDRALSDWYRASAPVEGEPTLPPLR